MGRSKKRHCVKYSIEITPTALAMLKRITDNRVRASLIKRIDGLSVDPEKQGKPLTGELSGLRSIRTTSQRYRIIYKIINERIVVVILAAGIRKEGDKKDIYILAKKLLKLKLVE